MLDDVRLTQLVDVRLTQLVDVSTRQLQLCWQFKCRKPVGTSLVVKRIKLRTLLITLVNNSLT